MLKCSCPCKTRIILLDRRFKFGQAALNFQRLLYLLSMGNIGRVNGKVCLTGCHFLPYQSLASFLINQFQSTSGYMNLIGFILFALLLMYYPDECQTQNFCSYKFLNCCTASVVIIRKAHWVS